MDLQHWVDLHPVGFMIGFIAYFCALWTVVCIVISLLSGWQSLSRRYHTENNSSTTINWGSGSFRYIVGYHNVLRMRSDADGLYLSVMKLFRLGHPPLLIPWSEIEVLQEGRFLFLRWRTFRLDRTKQIPLTLQGKVVDKILAANGAKNLKEIV
jgi:hypothetical protein